MMRPVPQNIAQSATPVTKTAKSRRLGVGSDALGGIGYQRIDYSL
jgi:hypothetical protein